MLLKNFLFIAGALAASTPSRGETVTLGNEIAPSMHSLHGSDVASDILPVNSGPQSGLSTDSYKRVHAREFIPKVDFGVLGPPQTVWEPAIVLGPELPPGFVFGRPQRPQTPPAPPPPPPPPVQEQPSSAPSPLPPPSPAEPPIVIPDLDFEPQGEPEYTYKKWETPKWTAEEEADYENWKDGPPHTPGEFEFSLSFAWNAFKDILKFMLAPAKPQGSNNHPGGWDGK